MILEKENKEIKKDPVFQMRKECVQFSYHFHVPLWYFSMNNNNRKNIKAAYLLWLIVTVSSQPHTGKKW